MAVGSGDDHARQGCFVLRNDLVQDALPVPIQLDPLP